MVPLTARLALAATLMLLAVSGCADEEQREWNTAADPGASVDEIIDNGNAAGIARSGDQFLVTWVVDPEDDEGPSQGAWRLYAKDGSHVADGTFGRVTEASARTDVWPVDDGFVLQDYVKHRFHRVNRSGRLQDITVDKRPPKSLAGGQFVSDDEGEGLGGIGFAVLPNGHVARLGKSPTDQPQDTVLAANGELWIGLPWTSDGEAHRYVHAKNGRAPWTTKAMPLPKGSVVWSQSMSTGAGRVYVPIGHENADRFAVDGFMSTDSDGTGRWRLIPADGIDKRLTVAPMVHVLPNGRLFASTDGEGAWLQHASGRWKPIRGIRTAEHSDADVSFAAGRLWSREWSFGHSLKYSTDYGKTWTDFNR